MSARGIHISDISFQTPFHTFRSFRLSVLYSITLVLYSWYRNNIRLFHYLEIHGPILTPSPKLNHAAGMSPVESPVIIRFAMDLDGVVFFEVGYDHSEIPSSSNITTDASATDIESIRARTLSAWIAKSALSIGSSSVCAFNSALSSSFFMYWYLVTVILSFLWESLFTCK